jgi:hypothetical protein
VFGVVLAGYVWTLAPGVTFWDAGEFIATAKILGIPHPPGTPLFVLIAHAFTSIVAFGGFAFRTNLMTAMFSAGAAAWFFLLVAAALRGWHSEERAGGNDLLRLGGAAAAALVSAFVFTVWQNSNETEVYMAATFSIAAACWLIWQWRRVRGTGRAPHILLLIVYLAAVSLGNHLLTLLVGPAIVGFVWHVLRTEPLADEAARRAEWSELWVLATIWWLLVAVGLGSAGLAILGGLGFAAALVYAFQVRRGLFPVVVLLVAAVGVSTYLFLYIRAGLHPFLNEADPDTLDKLLAVMRREQYPPRSPLDDPTYASGLNNPGRTPGMLLLQVTNFLQYFDWQWANGLAAADPVFARKHPLFTIGGAPIGIRLPFTLLFASLGVVGARVLYRKDRSVFWLLAILCATTGPVLLGYMNFKPGFSLAWDQYPDNGQHEVRERDYFFTVCFQVWGLFAGVGIAGLAGRAWSAMQRRVQRQSLRLPAGIAVCAMAGGLATLPFALNFRAASRAHGPTTTLAHDFAYDLLQSVDPYGILITNGDNDTFPLWYLQEVEGVRQDVAVVNLSLGNTDWYLRQLRDNPVRPFVPAQAPWLARRAPAAAPPGLHSWTDADINSLRPMLLPEGRTFAAGRVTHEFPRGTPFYVKDVLVLRLIQENVGRRPVFFSVTAGPESWRGLDAFLTQEALVLRLNDVSAPDTTRLGMGLAAIPLDVPRTDSLAWHVYRYAGLMTPDSLELDPTDHTAAADLSYAFFGLALSLGLRGDTPGSERNLARALHLRPDPDLAGRLREFVATARLRADAAARTPPPKRR